MSTNDVREKTQNNQNAPAGNGNINGERRCARCQALLQPGKAFCTECGLKDEFFKEKKTNLFVGKKKQIILGVAIVAIVAVIVSLAMNLNQNSSDTNSKKEDDKKAESGINFKEKFAEYEGEEWCEFAEDGSWMKIDTNPNDEGITQDIIGLGLYLEMEIPEINKELGFPDSVNQKMIGTTYNDGLLEEETDDVKMSWRYSDQRGLELLYENK